MADPTNTTAPPALRMLARGFCLRRKPRTEPLAPCIFADIARCGDGLVVARWERDGAVYAVALPPAAEIPDDHPQLDRDLTIGMQGRDWAGDIRRSLGGPDSVGQFWQLEPTAATEQERFAREWPEQARALGYRPPDPPRVVFPAGPVHYPRDFHSRGIMDGNSLRALLCRHQAGDWGDHGTHAAQQLDAAQRWMLPLLDVETQNREAVRTFSGAARSRYPLEGPGLVTLRSRRPSWDQTRYSIDVTTAFNGGPITLISLHVE